MTAGFSPNAPNRALFSRVAEGRAVLLPKKKKKITLMLSEISLRTFAL